jgi:RHS repeat-associated protein
MTQSRIFTDLFSTLSHLERKILVLRTILLLVVLVGCANAQVSDPAAGILPFSTHVSGPVDSLDLATDNIHINIPIRSKTGAIPFSYALIGNSHAYTFTSTPPPPDEPETIIEISHNILGNGMNLLGAFLRSSPNGVLIACDGDYKDPEYVWSVVDSTMAAHPLPLSDYTDADGCISPPQGAVATDGSGYTVNFTTDGKYVNGGTIYDRLGNETPGPTTPYTMLDPDNNKISAAITNNGRYILSYNDTLIPTGTPYFLISNTSTPIAGANGVPDTYEYTDAAGGTQTVQVNYSPYTIATNFGCGSAGIDIQPASIYLPSSIVLADGGTYAITYETTPGSQFQGTGDVTGRIAQITFPSGGYVQYAYSGSGHGGSNGFDCQFKTVPTLKRTVSDNNGNVGTWTYVSSTSSGLNTVTETDPLNNQTVYTFSGVPAFGFQQTSVSYYQGNATGTPLKSVATCYNATAYPCTSFLLEPGQYIYQKDEYVSLNGSATSWIETKYDQYGNTTEVTSYNASGVWGSGATTTLVSDKLIAYGQSWNGGTGCNAYSSGYIRDTPCYTQVTNGSGTVVAKTQVTNSSTGHPTSTSKWVTGTTWVTSSATYNGNGTIATATDPNSNTTTYNYNGSCNSIVSTSTTFPKVNGVTLTTSQAWDCNGGVVNSSTDANGNKTTYNYVNPTTGLGDPLYRQTQVSYPDGGGTTTTYNTGATLPWSISTSTLITSTTNLNETTIYDGLSRETQVQLTSDPSGTDYVDTTYDLLGRKATVSNPHRSASSSTDGITTYYYDPLNRVTEQLQPDNSQINTVYNGLCTTVTDEAGNARESCTDGVGRMTGVWEDPAHLDYETDYNYDAVNNMLSVTQKGGASSGSWRLRSFVYDGLSRLTSATNPESGNIGYTYDANSNLQTKTALSPNQASNGTATVVTTYTYDALNRLTGKSYADSYKSNPITPAVSYGYDGTAPSGCTPPTVTSPTDSGIPTSPTNALGRRSGMCDPSGATAWVYDLMGRPSIEERTLNGVTKNLGYIYYLDGQVKNLMYVNDDRVAFSVTAAGRIDGVSDDIGFDVAYNATFTPNGMITSMSQFAESGPNTVSFTSQYVYNQRLQHELDYASYTSATGPTYIYQRCYDYHLGGGVNITYGGVTCSFSNTTAADNGNVYQITNNLNTARSQVFTYDSLNRINQAYSTGATWGQQFNPDAWGNLTSVAAITGYPLIGGFTATATTSNQLSCTAGCATSYDAAGNTIGNGNGLITYDAENRILTTNGVTYTYDGDGKRVEKSSGTLYWTGVGDEPLSESDLSGNMNEEYIFFNGMRVTKIDLPSDTVHAFVYDHLGSSRMSVVPSAPKTLTVEEDLDYTPYGIVANGAPTDHYQFTGKEYDSESGLNNFGARYDAATLGRFMTPDWAAKPTTVPYAKFGDPQTLNLYSYVENGPLNRVDISGHNFANPQLMAMEEGNEADYACGWCNSHPNEASNGNMNGTDPANTSQTQQSQAQNQSGQSQPKSGEGSQANLSRREGIANAAVEAKQRADLGEKQYGSNQCSALVADCISKAGAKAEFDDSGRPPVAGEWANKKAKISGWRVLGPDEKPEPGDVAAVHIQNPHFAATGDSAIVVMRGNKLSAIQAGDHGVEYNSSFINGYEGVVYRRYTGD